MTDGCKTMKLAGIRESGNGYRGVYECQVCHGVLLDRDNANSLSAERFKPSSVAGMTCSLCDRHAPLSEQYRMGLTTVQSACGDVGETPVDCADYGFPSFEKFYSFPNREDSVFVTFRIDGGPLINAHPHEIEFSPTENRKQLFDSILNGQIEPLNPRLLALEVVDRVLHDLKLEYGENAGLETRTLQDASREGREA